MYKIPIYKHRKFIACLVEYASKILRDYYSYNLQNYIPFIELNSVLEIFLKIICSFGLVNEKYNSELKIVYRSGLMTQKALICISMLVLINCVSTTILMQIDSNARGSNTILIHYSVISSPRRDSNTIL